eukprot:s840_g13.t1
MAEFPFGPEQVDKVQNAARLIQRGLRLGLPDFNEVKAKLRALNVTPGDDISLNLRGGCAKRCLRNSCTRHIAMRSTLCFTMDFGSDTVVVPRRLLSEILEDGICPLHLRIQIQRLLSAPPGQAATVLGTGTQPCQRMSVAIGLKSKDQIDQ